MDEEQNKNLYFCSAGTELSNKLEKPIYLEVHMPPRNNRTILLRPTDSPEHSSYKHGEVASLHAHTYRRDFDTRGYLDSQIFCFYNEVDSKQ